MDTDLIKLLENMLESLQYGELTLKVQGGKILDVVKTERIRVGK